MLTPPPLAPGLAFSPLKELQSELQGGDINSWKAAGCAMGTRVSKFNYTVVLKRSNLLL